MSGVSAVIAVAVVLAVVGLGIASRARGGSFTFRLDRKGLYLAMGPGKRASR
jgi:hypothetical protein